MLLDIKTMLFTAGQHTTEEAQVKVDGVLVCDSMTQIKGTQFYSCPWNSSASCAKGLHKLEITVFDGKVRRTEQVVFSLDGTVNHLGPRLMVGMQMPTALFALWALVLVCAGATLLALGVMACVWKQWKRNPSRAPNVSVCFGPHSVSRIARAAVCSSFLLLFISMCHKRSRLFLNTTLDREKDSGRC